MTIKIGDKFPSVTLKWLQNGAMEEVDTASYLAGKTVVLFAVPGAFTPTCAQKHLPSYIENAGTIKAKGVDEIICLAVNDPFVMSHWAGISGAEGVITMLPDGNGALTKALGLELDGSGAGLGTRSKRYSMVIEDGVVKDLQVEDKAGEMSVSGGQACAARL